MKTIATKIPVVRHIAARPRLLFGALLGLLSGFILPDSWELPTRGLAAGDIGIIIYLALAMRLMLRSEPDDIQDQAAQQEAGRIGVLLMTVTTAIASLAAVVMELSLASELTGAEQGWHVALAAGTVLLSWFFMHTMFGVHYAHEYYSGSKRKIDGGLEFPQDDKHPHKPDYWDFIHFAFVIGVASQTADVEITSYILRRVVTMHCVVAFFFNTTVLALTVNIGASLLG